MRALILTFLGAASLGAQPVIYSGGVVNSAGYLPATSAGGAIAQGSVFSIFGRSLGPPLPSAQAAGFPLSNSLAGVSIQLVHQTGVSFAAIPVFVSDGQINAILPSATPVGLVSVQVTYNNRSSAAEPIKVVRSSFGVFTRNSAGSGPAIAQNFIAPDQQPLNSPAVSALPGQSIVLWGTGLGPIAAPDNAAPPPGNLTEPLELTLAGRPVPVDYAGRSPCCAGVDQINFRIPADAPSGCAVPLAVKMQNGVYSNFATIAVNAAGGPCSDPWNLTANAGRWAQLSLRREVTDLSTSPVDSVTGIFQQTDPLVRYPTPGTCFSAGPTAVIAKLLDAGSPLTLTGPQGARQIPRNGSIYNLTSAGGSPFLGPGAYTLTGPGGADVGAFQASLLAPAPLTWGPTDGDRFHGVTWSWSGYRPPATAETTWSSSQGRAFFARRRRPRERSAFRPAFSPTCPRRQPWNWAPYPKALSARPASTRDYSVIPTRSPAHPPSASRRSPPRPSFFPMASGSSPRSPRPTPSRSAA
jgi:uncharacterized protein (TIGR03437 family)